MSNDLLDQSLGTYYKLPKIWDLFNINFKIQELHLFNVFFKKKKTESYVASIKVKAKLNLVAVISNEY